MFNYMLYDEWEESLRLVCAAVCYMWIIHIAKCLCVLSAGVHEFPDDIFTNQERMDGAVALHVLCVSISTICFSFSTFNTVFEITQTLEVTRLCVPFKHQSILWFHLNYL